MNMVCATQASLTATENKVLTLMRMGKTNREIAAELGRSVFTVKVHVEHILSKTGALNRTHACVMYFQYEATAEA